MLCLHAQGARRLCFVGLRDTKFQRLLCARLVTPAVTLDPRQSYKAGVNGARFVDENVEAQRDLVTSEGTVEWRFEAQFA